MTVRHGLGRAWTRFDTWSMEYLYEPIKVANPSFMDNEFHITVPVGDET